MAFKKCPACGIMLGYNKFGCNKSRKDNMQPYCRSCMKKARKASAKKAKSKELARERQKKYREKKKLVKNTSIKETQKVKDSITPLWKHNEPKDHRITLNPLPVKSKEE